MVVFIPLCLSHCCGGGHPREFRLIHAPTFVLKVNVVTLLALLSRWLSVDHGLYLPVLLLIHSCAGSREVGGVDAVH